MADTQVASSSGSTMGGEKRTFDDGVEDVDDDEVTKQAKTPLPTKKKRRVTVTGRQRAILAWERNLRAATDGAGVSFGTTGWPPNFPAMVEEMRRRLISETGKKCGWDGDDVAMLRKYYYLKHEIPVSNSCFGAT